MIKRLMVVLLMILSIAGTAEAGLLMNSPAPEGKKEANNAASAAKKEIQDVPCMVNGVQQMVASKKACRDLGGKLSKVKNAERKW